ncbi:MAG: hypothetical protein H6716_28120 [Polyangiaceae bacterium]|nr:hypothetical protein [Polyangiaceae bacterium]
MPKSDAIRTRSTQGAIAVALVATLLAGVAMRWALAGRVPMVWDFAQLRHAHAHLAYYGVLIPLAWLGWASTGLRWPSLATCAVYAGFVILATLGFLRAGYAPEAIVGSTVVGGIWLWSAWATRERLSQWTDPLGGLLPGMILALACVPFVARFTRVEPALAQQWVATFLSALLLLVVLPTALGVLRVRRLWPLLLATGVLGSLGLGVWPHPVALVGLAVFGILLLPWRFEGVPLHLRVVWSALGLGVVGMAVGVLPNVRPVVLGAIHFAALSVALPSMAGLLRLNPDSPLWWLHHGAVVLLCAPLVAQAFAAGAWTWEVSAIGGTGVLLAAVGGIGWVLVTGGQDGSD